MALVIEIRHNFKFRIKILKSKYKFFEEVSSYQYQGTKTESSFYLRFSEPVELFSGEIQIFILNPDSTICMNKYLCTGNQEGVHFNYSAMDLKSARAGAKLIMDLILDDGKSIEIPNTGRSSMAMGIDCRSTVCDWRICCRLERY